MPRRKRSEKETAEAVPVPPADGYASALPKWRKVVKSRDDVSEFLKKMGYPDLSYRLKKLDSPVRADKGQVYPRCNYCINPAGVLVNPEVLVRDREIICLHKEGVPAIEIAARLNVAPEPSKLRSCAHI